MTMAQSDVNDLEFLVVEVVEKKFDLKQWYGFWKNYGIDYMEVKENGIGIY